MIWDMTNFTLIGLFLGVVVRFIVATDSRRPAVPLLVTVVPGMVGSVLGGITSWYLWPADNGQFHWGAMIAAIVGAGFTISLAVLVLRKRGSIG